MGESETSESIGTKTAPSNITVIYVYRFLTGVVVVLVGRYGSYLALFVQLCRVV